MEPTLESIKAYPRAMRFYIYTLYEFVLEMKCKKVLELGTQNGQSARAVLLALKANNRGRGYGTLVSVDHKDRSTILDAAFQNYKPYWNFIRGDTTKPETIQAVKDTLEEGEMFDLLVIDAGHKYPQAKADWDNYSKLVRPGGVIFLHDTVNKNEEVWKVWDEIDWPEKFNMDWGLGRASDNLIVGMGIVKKPLE